MDKEFAKKKEKEENSRCSRLLLPFLSRLRPVRGVISIGGKRKKRERDEETPGSRARWNRADAWKKKKKPGIWIQSWDIKAGRVQHPRAGARRAWVLRIAIQIARRGWGHLRASSVPPKTDRREKRSSSNRKSHSRNGRPFLYRFYDCLQRYVVIFRRNIWKNRTSLAYISFQFSIIVIAFNYT